MKKHLYLISISCIMAMLFLSACGGDYPEMSPDEEEVIGEYAARILLKYDANNRSRLVSRVEVEEKEEKDRQRRQMIEEVKRMESEATEKNTSESKTSDAQSEQAPEEQLPLEEVLGLPQGVTVVYQGYEMFDSYPGGETADFFSLDATEGKRLLVCRFTIMNLSGAEQYIDFLNQNVTSRITINDDYSRNALVTMLEDDLLTYAANVGDGETVNTVVVFEIDENQTYNMGRILLALKKESNKYTIQVQ
ncbi:MAG: hypothetical protein K6G30_09575 [Acetatifactor sp.]|nr:hypothetical protein [Acetatifactor sp.]